MGARVWAVKEDGAALRTGVDALLGLPVLVLPKWRGCAVLHSKTSVR